MKELPPYRDLWEKSIKDFKDIYWWTGPQKMLTIRFRWHVHNFKGSSDVCQTDFLNTHRPLSLSHQAGHHSPVLSLCLNPGATDKPRNAQEKYKLSFLSLWLRSSEEKSKPHSEWAQTLHLQSRIWKRQEVKQGAVREGAMWPSNPPLTLFCMSHHLGTKPREPEALFQDLEPLSGISGKAS